MRGRGFRGKPGLHQSREVKGNREETQNREGPDDDGL